MTWRHIGGYVFSFILGMAVGSGACLEYVLPRNSSYEYQENALEKYVKTEQRGELYGIPYGRRDRR